MTLRAAKLAVQATSALVQQQNGNREHLKHHNEVTQQVEARATKNVGMTIKHYFKFITVEPI